MTKDMQLRGLSERTQEAYLRAIRKLAEHYGASPDGLTEGQVANYVLYLKNNKKYAPAGGEARERHRAGEDAARFDGSRFGPSGPGFGLAVGLGGPQ